MDASLFGGIHSVGRKAPEKQAGGALHEAADNVMIRTLFMRSGIGKLPLCVKHKIPRSFMSFPPGISATYRLCTHLCFLKVHPIIPSLRCAKSYRLDLMRLKA